MLDDRRLQGLGAGRAAIEVDVEAIGLVADHGDMSSELLEHLGSDVAGGSVGAVEHDANTVERASVERRDDRGDPGAGDIV